VASEFERDRAAKVWEALGQAFGKDALIRRFGAVPPELWAVQLGKLGQHELERGMRRLMFAGRAQPPTLPELLKLCRAVEDETDHNAPQPQYQLTSPQSQMDKWAVVANLHLLAHIARQAVRGVRYHSAHLHRFPMPKETDQDSIDLISPLLQARDGWCEGMREYERDGQLPADHGRDFWNECMRNGEIAVNYVRQQHQQRARAA
jgi:hypothetical protein